MSTPETKQAVIAWLKDHSFFSVGGIQNAGQDHKDAYHRDLGLIVCLLDELPLKLDHPKTEPLGPEEADHAFRYEEYYK